MTEKRFEELLMFATKIALAMGGDAEKELAKMIDKWNEEDEEKR